MGALTVLLRKNVLLKRRQWKGTLVELLMPIFFVVLFAQLKGLTDKVRVPIGWSQENKEQCNYPRDADSFEKSCSYPYEAFQTETTRAGVVLRSFDGSWNGHEFARLCLAVGEGGGERERIALSSFVTWAETVGGAEGPVTNFSSLVATVGEGTDAELNAYASSEDYGEPFNASLPECAAAVVFNTIDFDSAQFTYTLRLNSTGAADRFEVTRTTRDPTDDFDRSLDWGSNEANRRYAEYGFVGLQQLIDSFFIDTAGTAGSEIGDQFEANVSNETDLNRFKPFGGRFLPFPTKEFFWDEFFFYVAEIMPLVFVLSYLYPVAKILEGLVREKETRTTEMLKMMGVGESSIIASWYLTYFVFFTVLAVIVTLFSRDMLPTTTAAGGGFSLFLFFLFLLFGVATTAFCFTLSTFFFRARTASFVGVIMYFMGFFLYYNINTPEVNPKPIFMLILPQVSFSLCIQTIATLEGSGFPANMDTMYNKIEGFAMWEGIVMLIVSIFLWTLAGVYLTAVLPREFGQRRPLLFPFTDAKHWIQQKLGSKSESSALVTASKSDSELTDPSASDDPNVEVADRSLREQKKFGRGIQVKSLSKEFDTPSGKKTAVNDLDLDIYEGQILALLGHNGAGKTTTLQMLSGMLPTTSGTATILGKDINTDMDSIRKSLGFCPQHDVLYATLTVREHLWFYGSLKGLSGDVLNAAIKKGVEEVGLTEKLDVQSRSLSGGQKRKLSVSISLIGGSKVVFVDEPTSGVDPFSRRSIWQVLQNNREGRVTILTTHFMDEADLLGDRIAIMAEGELRCCGSSLFLKDRYGAGYLLTVVKKPECDVDVLTQQVKSFVPEATIVSNVGTEISFQLPTASSPRFGNMFTNLDQNLDKLRVEQYGISLTTLEQVFIKVARADEQQTDDSVNLDDLKELEEAIAKAGEGSVPSVDITKSPQLGEFGVFKLHLGAMLRKRFQYSKRDRKSFMCSVLMPLVLYAAGLLILKLVPVGLDDPVYVMDTKDLNPDLPLGENVHLPVVELDEESATISNITQPGMFSQFIIEPLALDERNLFPGEERVVFDHTYIDGLPTEEECAGLGASGCDRPLRETHGNAVLEFATDMLAENQSAVAERNGAKLYATAVIQPQEVDTPFGCLLTRLEVDIEQGRLVLNYVEDYCTNSGAGCALLEGSFQGQESCLPAGCFGNLNSETIKALAFQTAGSNLSPEELEAVANQTRVMACTGDLCNTGPSTLLDDSVCRGPDTETCISNGLVAYKVNTTDFSLYVSPNEEYCDGRVIVDESDISGNTGGFDGQAPPGLGSSTDGPRECMVSGIPQALQTSLVDLLVGNTTIETSYTDAGTCVDEATFPVCTFRFLEGGGLDNGNACFVDSCVPEDEATMALLEAVVIGLAEAPREPCSQLDAICDQVIDFAAVQLIREVDLSELANTTELTLFGLALNDTVIQEVFNNLLLPDANITAFTELLAGIDGVNSTNVLNELIALTTASVNPTGVVELLALFNTTDPVEILEILVEGDLDLDDILANNTELANTLVELLGAVANAESTIELCEVDSVDLCVMAQMDILGQKLCIPAGCAKEFTTIEYAYIPVLGGGDVNQIDFFTCNVTQCNYGCQGADNCRADLLTPARYDAELEVFSESFDICSPLPVHYTYTAMLNTTSRHILPILTSEIHTALLRSKLFSQFPGFKDFLLEEDGTVKEGKVLPRITVQSQPLPLTNNVKTVISGIIAFVAAIFALIAFAFIPASVASYVVQEREVERNVKHQQLVSGASIFSYWISFYAFDVLMYMIPLFGSIALIAAFQIDSYINDGALEAVFILLLGYGLAVIPFAYLTSWLFKTHTTALIMTLFINLMTGLVLMVASYVMDNLETEPAVQAFNADAKAYYRIFPGFCMGDSLVQLATIKIIAGILGSSFEAPKPLDWDVMGSNIVYLYSEAVVFFILVLLIEVLQTFQSLSSRFCKPPAIEDAEYTQDEDVVAEEERVLSGEANRDVVRMEGLRKVFGSYAGKKKVAVRDITLGIPRGECFGLLGINGAGKSTTFKMITGDIFPTRGTAYLNGLDVLRNQRQIRSLIGYCPQFDALLPLLTVREHLELFGRIKGLFNAPLERAVVDIMDKLTLRSFENKLAQSLSGGNKRKLSLAVAAIGSPEILFADEPSTGMDVVSKRFMWTVLLALCKGGITGKQTTIVLTSHSMEEVEALCSRLTIMVGGRMRCIGSPQHLKHRFGEGLSIELKLHLPSHEAVISTMTRLKLDETLEQSNLEALGRKLGNPERMRLVIDREDAAWVVYSHLDVQSTIPTEVFLEWWLLEESFDNLNDFVEKSFPGASLTERHESQLTYQIPITKLALVFNSLESNRDRLKIASYGASSTTLDMIFNRFAAQQDEEKGRARGMLEL